MKYLLSILVIIVFSLSACGGGGSGSVTPDNGGGNSGAVANAIVIDFRTTSVIGAGPTDGPLITLPDGTTLSFTALGAQVYVNGAAEFVPLAQVFDGYGIAFIKRGWIEIWDYSGSGAPFGIIAIDWRLFGAPRLYSYKTKTLYEFFGPPGENPMRYNGVGVNTFTTVGETMGEITYQGPNVIAFNIS